MFNLFKKNKPKKANIGKIFVCKHCKLHCKECNINFCYSCFANAANPCPKCGKRNIDPK